MRDDQPEDPRPSPTGTARQPDCAPPTVRLAFSQRLRTFRAARGFKRARAFAAALELEENRYTRYERAEVEPTLTVLCKICDRLGATPNDLLGYVRQPKTAPDPVSTSPVNTLDVLAWQVATAIVALRDQRAEPCGEGKDLIAQQGRIVAVFRELQSKPIEAACALIGDPVLEGAGRDARAAFGQLVQSYMSQIGAGTLASTAR